jgi:type IV pilus assembly protein PilE
MEAKQSSVPAVSSAGGSARFSAREVLIGVAMLGVAVSCGLRPYREYVRRAAIEDVTTLLGAARIVAEQYYLDSRTYVGAPCPGETNSFRLSCRYGPVDFLLTASGFEQLDGFVFTLDQEGRRTTTGPRGQGNCWLTGEGDTCAAVDAR